MVGTVVLVTLPLRIGQHLLAHRLAASLGLDTVDYRLQFHGSLDRQHLRHLVAMLEPHRAGGVVGPQFSVMGA
jgi:hypothetical protein